VEAPVVGAVVLFAAPVVLDAPAPVVLEAPGAPVVLGAGVVGVVVGVIGLGGATSWRSSPPGQVIPTTTAATSTTPNAIGSTTFS